MDRQELYDALVSTCERFGFLTDYSEELLESLMDSLIYVQTRPPRVSGFDVDQLRQKLAGKMDS